MEAGHLYRRWNTRTPRSCRMPFVLPPGMTTSYSQCHRATLTWFVLNILYVLYIDVDLPNRYPVPICSFVFDNYDDYRCFHTYDALLFYEVNFRLLSLAF